MGPDRNKHLRNVAIILVLALAVWRLPGGDEGSSTIISILGILFWGGLLFLGYRMYMEHRMTLFGLEDRQRATLYGAVALLGITLIATSRMWAAGGFGAIAWFALIGLAVYALAGLYRATREY